MGWDRLANCTVQGNRTCYNVAGHWNGTDFPSVNWPFVHLSRRLLVEVAHQLNASSLPAKGHHEALTSAICSLNSWCKWSSINQSFVGINVLGAWGIYLRRECLSLQFLITLHSPKGAHLFEDRRIDFHRNRLYHPVKCEADNKTGEEAVKFATHPYYEPGPAKIIGRCRWALRKDLRKKLGCK